MRISTDELYKQELEFYTHKIAEGELTPLVFELLKSTNDIFGLLEHLGYKRETGEAVGSAVTIGDTFSQLFERGVEVS